ncbi:hypothetical protein [Sphingomicrobium marinum]|uniref:hypothetical protein n=1 Tax=Sphingomicrobium marinum TaxID=1227950 RepID=UPI00223EF3C5|nr:hypothetical protein [Sphingomicrobium marinum]
MVATTGIMASLLIGLSIPVAVTIPIEVQSTALQRGEDQFRVAVDADGRDVDVFVYRAHAHGPNDPVIIVLAGMNRNADDYRRAWIDAAERYNLMIVAPEFSKQHFPQAADYNIGGMLREDSRRNRRDETLPFADRSDWLFTDIERVFDAARVRYGLIQNSYDLFGHSAGGQIVHRMVMFAPDARINRAVAANAGWYTVPDFSAPFPYGLDRLDAEHAQLDAAFDRRMTVLLGARDQGRERRSSLRRSRLAKQQGNGRLDRGRYFYDRAEKMAQSRQSDFNWSMRVVGGVGHDYRAMSQAAADHLYAPKLTMTGPL